MLRRLTLLVLTAALLVGACGSAPSLTDPKQILTQALQSLKTMKSAHLKADISGQVALAQLGQKTLDLKGTSLEGDVDFSSRKTKLTLAVPALLGLSADLLAIDQTTYVRMNGLLGASNKYQKSSIADGGATSAASDPQKALDQLAGFLDQPGVNPTKKADEKCGLVDCYRVSLTLPSSDLEQTLGAIIPGVTANGTVDVWVQKSDLRPVQMTVLANAGDQGSLEVNLQLSNFDVPVTIEAPPADQIENP